MEQPTIYDWELIPNGGCYCIRGKILHDHRWEDGTPIQTSWLREINFVDGVAVTNNTTYFII